MKHFLSLAIAVLLWHTGHAQRTVAMHNLWAKPQVHVSFNDYTISFKIKDINRALELLAETGDSIWGMTSALDTARQYSIELYEARQQYRMGLERMIQNAVGPFLLMAGQAEIRHGRKKLRKITANITQVNQDAQLAYIKFYDPRNGRLLFCGEMAVDMYNKDMGID